MTVASSPDYGWLIDAETWAFIRRTEACYPPDAAGMPVERQRAVYDAMCRLFHAGYPAGVSAHDATLAGVPCRAYAAPGPMPAVVLYLHGGGFVVGGLDSHDDVCAEICGATGFEVVSADYRLAPEHPHPAAFEDALAVFGALAGRDGRPVVLAGDSAGGNLAAAVSHAVRGRGRQPAGQVLVYPGLGGDRDAGSYLLHARAPMLTRDDILFYEGVRFPEGRVARDPTTAPLTDSDFSGLPPTCLVSAQCDPLSDDGKAYRDRILGAGGHAIWIEAPGLVHGYLRARHEVARARDSFAGILAAISRFGAGQGA